MTLLIRALSKLENKKSLRTYFHISQSYKVSESTAYKTIRWVEDTLIKHPLFALPGRKELLKSDMEYEIILIDATETPIEHPKKTKTFLLWEEEKTYAKDAACNEQGKKKDYLHLFF